MVGAPLVPARARLHGAGMRYRAIVLGLSLLAAATVLLPAAGASAATGGLTVPSGGSPSGGSGSSGGSSGGGASTGTKYKPRHRLVASVFTLADTSITAGQSVPKVTVLLTQPDVPKVVAYVQVTPPSGGGKAVRVDLGTISTGKKRTFTLPKGKLPGTSTTGSYALRLSAVTPQGQTLTRTERSPGRATLRVEAEPVVQETPDDSSPEVITPEPGQSKSTPTETPSSSSSVRFPVAGSHTFGGSGSRFGVGRTGHSHQGQDVAADTGTPVVAPTAGEITVVGYQASAAGEWVAMHSTDGRDFFFAHCVRHSTAVREGDDVRAGTHLCDVGETGDASGPHLHFEIWVNGWRTSSKSHPIDPLPQLKLWQAADPKW